MLNWCYRITNRKKGLLIDAFFQNGFYMFKGTGVQRQRSMAGGFQTLR